RPRPRRRAKIEVPVHKAFPEGARFTVGKSGPTPVAFAYSNLNTLELKRGFGKNGIWLRPGSLIEIQKIHPESIDGPHQPENEAFVNDDTGEIFTHVIAIRFKTADAFEDRKMTKPYRAPGVHAHATYLGGVVTPHIF